MPRVADTLEADWNTRLRELADARDDYARARGTDVALDEDQQARVLALAADFPALWKADVILSDLRSCTSASSTATGAETRLPAACERLNSEVAAAAKSGSNPSAVAAAVHQQSTTVREQGFAEAIRLSSLIILIALILPFCLVFLLPRFPRRYDEYGSGEKEAG